MENLFIKSMESIDVRVLTNNDEPMNLHIEVLPDKEPTVKFRSKKEIAYKNNYWSTCNAKEIVCTLQCEALPEGVSLEELPKESRSPIKGAIPVVILNQTEASDPTIFNSTIMGKRAIPARVFAGKNEIVVIVPNDAEEEIYGQQKHDN